jgi:hypothetical protein
MSHMITFDTLAFVKTLEAYDIKPKQAEGITAAVAKVFEENLSISIFTKEDGKLLKSELKSDIFKLKSEVIMWVVGLLFAQTAIIVSIIKFIH